MMLLQKLNFRLTNACLLVASIVGMSFALYLEHVQGLEPCPLCVFQRVGLMAMGLFAFIALLHNPVKKSMRRLYAVLMLLGVGWSFGVASRHVWLQHLPKDQVPACGPGLDFWLDAFPFSQVLKMVLSGSGECAKVSANFLGFSIPEWGLLFFGGLLIVVVVQLIKPIRN